MRSSLIIFGFFVAGVLAGLSGKLPTGYDFDKFGNYALFLLMFLAGVSIGSDKNSWKVLSTYNYKIIWVPVTIIVGTLAGSALVTLVIPTLTLRESLAVGAGFGYYSLSSAFITQLHSHSLGVVALLSNIFREVATLLATPILVKYFGNLAGIASGGATAMDTTLPVISKYSGKSYAIIAVFSGIVLTILVPFLVTLILTFKG
ncbi:MAG: lysine exporter LysO family protein [Prolixibacteraceae bacterium]|nr:lysine exporter LysO family protein [Prolixibacteraceae bacterium]